MAAKSWVATKSIRYCSTSVQVTVPSLAKLNLDLRVLGKRPDGYHELRTIFQTVSLGDRLTIGFEPSKTLSLDLDSSIDIPDNLILRAARLVVETLKIRAHIRISLKKKIPMGAGLGGGSSNAASILLALPALAHKPIAMAETVHLAKSLGSDVPFFLLGGTALGIGRGTELYPMVDLPRHSAVIVHSGVHVSTAEAYRALGYGSVTNALTSQPDFPMLGEFQAVAWNLNRSPLEHLSLKNDFEEPVFALHPELASTARKLRRLGARPSLMTGSGSAVFGIFANSKEASAAAAQFKPGTAHVVHFVSRKQYAKLWTRAVGHSSF